MEVGIRIHLRVLMGSMVVDTDYELNGSIVVLRLGNRVVILARYERDTGVDDFLVSLSMKSGDV